MNDQDLQSLWQAESSGLPSAFTVAELVKTAPRPPAEEAKAAAIFHQSVPFLRSLLLMRRRAHLMKLYGAAAAIPLSLFIVPALSRGRWLLPVMLAVFALATVRQWVRVLRLDRSVAALRDDQRVGEAHAQPRWQRPVQLGILLLVGSLTLVAGVGYWTGGEHRSRQMLAREAAQCQEVLPTDVARAVIACERVLRRTPDHLEAAASLRRHRAHLRCLEKLGNARQLISRGSAELALAELDSLGPECPNVVVRSAALDAAALVSPVTTAAQLDCLRAMKAEQWAEALERCGVYARYACRGKSPDWQATDEAFQGLLRARSRLVPSSAAGWQCPDSAVLRPP